MTSDFVVYIAHEYPTRTQTFVESEYAEVVRLGVPARFYPLHVSDVDAPADRLTQVSIFKSACVAVWSCVRYAVPIGKLLLAKPVSLHSISRQLFALYKAANLNVILSSVAARRAKVHLHAHFLGRTLEVAVYAAIIRGRNHAHVSATAHAADARGAGSVDRLKKLLSAVDFVACASQKVESELRSATGYKRTSVVHCGVAPAGEKKTASRTVPSLLSVGRMVEKKGFDVCLRAARRLREAGVPFTWTFVGDGPLRAELEGASCDLVSTGHLRWLGHRDHSEVLRLMAEEADVLVLPSKRAPGGDVDGIPVVLMEAMTRGVLVVTSRISGIPELVREGVTGRLVNPDDDEDLCNVLKAVLQDLELDSCRAMRVAAKNFVDAGFNSTIEAAKMLALFDGGSHRLSVDGPPGDACW